MAGMRRSEVSALRWADIDDAANGDGILAGYRRTAGFRPPNPRAVRPGGSGPGRVVGGVLPTRGRCRSM